jgi:hypothetical protein
MNETVELTMNESERAEFEATFDQCLVEIKQLRDECERLGAATDERLRRLRRDREYSREGV